MLFNGVKSVKIALFIQKFGQRSFLQQSHLLHDFFDKSCFLTLLLQLIQIENCFTRNHGAFYGILEGIGISIAKVTAGQQEYYL